MALVILCFLPTTQSLAATFTVDATGHTADANAGDGSCADSGGDCTLRAAIEEANSLAGADTIQFDGTTFSSATTINITTVLTLSGGSTTIDGGSDHYVVVNGSGTSSHDCFDVTSASNIIRGLVIQNCNYGIHITGSSASGNRIENNYISTNATAASAVANDYGVFIENGADSNIVGTNGDGSSDSSEGNIIAGSSSYEIQIEDAATDSNIVAGNYLGLAANGTTALATNGSRGVSVFHASDNRIGTDGNGTSDTDERNVIVGDGSSGYGIVLSGSDNSGNLVAGNYIGLNAAGTSNLDHYYGIGIVNSADDNIIGYNGVGSASAMRNIISGHDTGYGIYIGSSVSTGNRIHGNYIGLNPAGTSAIANAIGVAFYNASSNIVGTNDDGSNDANEGNVISGNSTGVYIYSNSVSTPANNNLVSGNIIGLAADGSTDVGNTSNGIQLYANGGTVSSNIIGTDGDGTSDTLQRNIISGNDGRGIEIYGSSTTSNLIAGNYIGLNQAGTGAVGNYNGIRIHAAVSNTIGYNGSATVATMRNYIAGSGYNGIYIKTGATSNKVFGNYIGLNAAGDSALANNYGIQIDAADGNTIGTDGNGSYDSDEGNVISGSTTDGVYITGSDSTSNVIAGNYIGTGPGGSGDFGNGRHGIQILNSAANNIVGGDSSVEANTIAYNGDASSEFGVYVTGSSTDGNQIIRNSFHDNQNIGIDLAGNGANNDIAAPANLTVSGISLTSDSVSANATVQIFHADDNSSCEGETYVGQATADGSGNWSFYLPGSFKNSTTTYFVATQTTTAAGTSEFSSCYTGTFFRRSIMID